MNIPAKVKGERYGIIFICHLERSVAESKDLLAVQPADNEEIPRQARNDIQGYDRD